MQTENSTIAALATSPAPAGIAVVRFSGPKTAQVLRALFRARHDPTADPRRLILGELVDFQSGAMIDRALAVYMPGPNSFTGEDVGEFQFHGSPLLVQKVLRSLYSFGIMPAEAGEFTKRAFLNGKMDLVQAEAIADLIEATSEQALKVASDHLQGRFSQSITTLGEPLRSALAEIEASIDFPEEGIEPKKLDQIMLVVRDCAAEIQRLLQTYSYGQVVREGFRVLLCGRPNVGKSSILNLLLGNDRAIVSEISGTTRDLIEESAIIEDFRFIFCDSAGLTDTRDTVEEIGIARARDRIAWADLVMFIADATDKSESWRQTIEEVRPAARKIWMVTNKIDLNPSAIGAIFCDSSTCAQNFYLSAKTGAGLDSLLRALVEEVRSNMGDAGEANNIITNERHRACLVRALESLEHAIDVAEAHLPLELLSAELRLALTTLEEMVGKTYTEDLLGLIFSRFCVGK